MARRAGGATADSPPRSGAPISAAASCAPRSTSSRRAATTTRRSRTSCAARARAAPRSTRSSTTAKTRCTARCRRRLRALLDTCAARSRARRARRRASSRSASRAYVDYLVVRSRRRADHLARRRRHVARGERAAQPHPPRDRRPHPRHLGRVRPRSRRQRRRPPRSRSACSASSSSRWCTSSRPTGSTKRRRTSPRSSTAVERSRSRRRLIPPGSALKLGIVTPVLTLLPRAHATWEETGTFADVVAIVQEADRLGYHHCTCSEHVGDPGRRRRRRAAAATGTRSRRSARSARSRRSIRFAAHVLVLGYHHPLAIAKRYGTLDVVTGGRVILGVGVGSLREEFELLGAPFADRGARADDAMRALRARRCRSASPSTTATYYDFDGFVVDPHALQAHVPLWVGGRTARSLRRAVELGDGWAPFGLRTAELATMLDTRARHRSVAARDRPDRRVAAERTPARSARRTRARRRTTRAVRRASARPA